MNVKVSYLISKDIATVFQAIVDKNKLSKYFVSFASHSLDEAKMILWKWEDYNAECEVEVLKVIKNERIEFSWNNGKIKRNVEIELENSTSNSTRITVIEHGFDPVEEHYHEIVQQTQGWTDFICSLKAFLYAGINLRS